MRMLCAAGIRRIVYAEDYKNDPLVTVFAEMANVEIVKES